jgi:hypothetical protein
VGLGVPLILAVTVLLFYCFRMRPQSKTTGNTQDATWNLGGYNPGQIVASKGASYGPCELGAVKDRSELYA